MNPTTPADQQAITDSVRNLYEKYPYPAPMSSLRIPSLEGWCNYTFLRYRAFNEWRDRQGCWILDAGCGTGETLWPLAINNPGAHIVGYDLSRVSLDLAREKMQRLGAVDVTLEQRDLGALPEPSQKFDFINSTGVLHHLADPLKGLRNLVGYLKEDGLMVLGLYADAPRMPIKKAEEVLGLLGGDDPLPEKVDMARRFFKSMPPGHELRNPSHMGERGPALLEELGEEHITDTFFHPRAVTYTVETLFDFLDAAGLEHVRFANEHAFDLKARLADPDLQRRAGLLSRRQQYHLADLLAPQGNYICMVRHRAWRPPDPPQAGDVPDLIPMSSPVVMRVDRTPLSPTPLVPQQTILEVTGFTQERYRLDDETARILALCDGVRTVREVAVMYGNREAGIQLLVALEQRSLVLFRR